MKKLSMICAKKLAFHEKVSIIEIKIFQNLIHFIVIKIF